MQRSPSRARKLPSKPDNLPASERAAQAVRLRRYATGLLFLMAAIFLASTWAMVNIHPGFVWVQAFSEAALVGGLADWFAVTALFRHPMGIPIPHTAIIPNSKDRIGDALATFLKENFLTPMNVARRLDGFDAASTLAGFLERPASGGRVRRGISRLLGQLSETPAARAVMQSLQDGAMVRLRALEISPLLGRMLDAMIADGRHRPVIDALIGWAGRALDSQEGLIRAMVEERTSWLLRLVNVDERIASELVGGLRGLLADLAADPDHPVREKADRALENLAFDLQHMPETREKVERMKRELMENPAVGEWMEGLWGRMQDSLKSLADGEGTREITVAMAKSLREDPALAAAVNQLARRAVVGTVADHGDAIVALVSDTVKGWDAATLSEKLENAVLRDLQYIRLNGTLIGGSIGIALHAVLVLTGAA
ncbi:MAG: DUF445 domain-containing protein [Sandarakinorhabdus sp.]|nr:DUF445 domain-containing protein [Sandarakinorhabdus sp.]